jgi:hypothetical protein
MPQSASSKRTGFALIIGILQPLRSWPFAAAASTSCSAPPTWCSGQVFIVADILVVGYVTTSPHRLFALLQLIAATETMERAYKEA